MTKFIQFQLIEELTNTIYLPFKIDTDSLVTLYHGLRQIEVTIKIEEDVDITNEDKIDNPWIVKCSQDVITRLLIVDHLTYQLKVKDNTIHIGPVIGIMMGEQYYYYHDRYLDDLTDSMRIYEQIGGLFIVFKTHSINWDELYLYGLYYDNQESKWKYSKLPLPSVIYRRTLMNKSDEMTKLYRLTEGKVFNSYKLDKYECYEILKESSLFKQYLPETRLLKSFEDLSQLIDRYQRVVIKPKGLSRGRGICFIYKINDQYELYDYRHTKSKPFTCTQTELSDFLNQEDLYLKDYIVQQYISLAKIEDNVFDIRVVMHKSIDNKWFNSGSECRLAGNGLKLTNISIGGKALTIDDAIKLTFNHKIDPTKVKKDLIFISKLFCEIMDDKNWGLFVEYGLDLAIDIDGNYWFIEGNFRPQFKGIKIIDPDSYYKIISQPIIYAVNLLEFKIVENDNEMKKKTK